MKNLRSINLTLCLLAVVCLTSCNNFLSQSKSSVNVELPANLYDILCAKASEDPSSSNLASFILTATMSGSYNQVQTQTITAFSGPVSIIFTDVPFNSVVTVEITISINNKVLFSGKSAVTTISNFNCTIDLTLSLLNPKQLPDTYVMWNTNYICIGNIHKFVEPYQTYHDKYVDSCIDSLGNVWAISDTKLIKYTKQNANSLDYINTELTLVSTPDGTMKSISYDSFTDKIYLAYLVSGSPNDEIYLYYINDASTINTNSCSIQPVLSYPMLTRSGITEITLTVSNDNYFIGYNSTVGSSKECYIYFIRIGTNDEGNPTTNQEHCCLSDLFTSAIDDQFNLAGCDFPKNFRITDMQVIDNSVYLLITDKYTGLASGISSSQTLISRGGIVKYDFKKGSLTLDETFGANDGDLHDSILGWTDTPATQFMYRSKSYDAFWPKNPSQRNDFTYRQNYSFFGPMSFLAVMPKKLIIGDSGYYYYSSQSGDNMETCRTNKTTFVEYDLETKTWDGIDLQSFLDIGGNVGSFYNGAVFGVSFNDADSAYRDDFTGFPQE